MSIAIRPFQPDDAATCYDVYVDAARNGTFPHYTAEQARAWAPSDTDDGEWTHRLGEGITHVATDGGDIVGFITLRRDGHLDLFFVRPAARPLGVAQRLYDALLDAARDLGLTGLTTDASHLARSFLARRGWRVTGTETVTRHGVDLTRSGMVLDALPPAAKDP